MSSLCGVAILLYTLGPGALVQDLDPDDLPLNLVAAHESDVVAKMLLAVERLDPGAIATHPVLCIYPHSHRFQYIPLYIDPIRVSYISWISRSDHSQESMVMPSSSSISSIMNWRLVMLCLYFIL